MLFILLLAFMTCSTDWTLHGLWEDYSNGTYPQYCTNEAFDLSALQSDTVLYTWMQKYWTGCYDQVGFWEHEWQKHGTCIAATLNITQLGFFNLTMSYYLEYQADIATNCSTVNPNTTCLITVAKLND
jgi:ribonuclease T2